MIRAYYPASWGLAVLMLGCTSTPPKPPKTFDFQNSIGVVLHRDDSNCLEIGSASLAAGQRFQFVTGVKPPESGEAEITRKLEKPCAFAENNQNETVMHSYQFKIVSGELPNAAPAFALTRTPGRLSDGATGYSADLDGDGQTEFLRACTSMEGVHLTVWSGAPLTGKRRWHYYHYLGYDVEPDCSPAESQPTGQ